MSNSSYFDRPNTNQRHRFQYDRPANSTLRPNFGSETAESSVSITHIPAAVSRQTIIAFAEQFGELSMEPHITPSDGKLKKVAYITFTTKSAFQLCMDSQRRQASMIDGYPPSTSGCTLDENELRGYFQTNYGQVKAFGWKFENVATIDFEDYDSVDRALITSLTHTINGITVRLEKMRSVNMRQAYENAVAPNDINFCVHVKNIPPQVSGEQLATLFGSRVWDVLIRKGKFVDVDPFEAWILKLNSMAKAQQLAESIKIIDGINIECNAEQEPLNEWTLCSGNRDGWCKHGNNCIYRHITCTYGDECTIDQCPYSHSTQRAIVPNPRYRSAGPIDQQYRIKIDGLPSNMTALELLTELKNQPLNLLNLIETPEMPAGSTIRHFYLTRQAAEKLARRRIYEWHGYIIRVSYIVKCQLEYDRAPIEQIPSSPSINNNGGHQLSTIFAPLSPGINEIIGMPSEWVWTNRRLGHTMSEVYLVYSSESNDNRLGAMKLYRHSSNLESMRARRELLALQALKNEASVVSIYQSNILDVTRKEDAPMWIITELVSESTFKNYVDKHKSQITLHVVLSLTRQLLNIIQRCHKARVIHRNLEPNNIMVQHTQIHASVDEVKLILIDFDLCWIDSQQSQISEEDDLTMIEYVIKRHSTDSVNQTFDNIFSKLTHYLSSNGQLNNPTLDSTGVCCILYWLITGKWLDQMSTVNFCYQASDLEQIINKKLGDIDDTTKVNEQLLHTFDRAFGPVDNRWHVDELVEHLTTIDTCLNDFEAVHIDKFFPAPSTMDMLPLDDPYSRTVTMLARIKQNFTQQYTTVAKWSHDKNWWSIKTHDNEVKNMDELIYNHQERHCTVPIVCIAKIEHDQTSLFLTTALSDSITSLKPICKLDNETPDMNFSPYYNNAIKKLVIEWLKRDI
ncbi:unnamed protein product [Rotaria magnacalcarata]|uniref:Uncharacterized protein n=1 Tax=Rotaria magnacalcarata TaxID=392030 RepID=A0A819M3Q2_9BILA|nr:unnamed protein product [Rotaria magnacalcarata]